MTLGAPFPGRGSSSGCLKVTVWGFNDRDGGKRPAQWLLLEKCACPSEAGASAPPPTLQVLHGLCVPPPSRASLGSHGVGQAPSYVLQYAVLLKVSNSRSNIQKRAILVEKQTWRLFLKVSLQMLREECFLPGIAQHPWMGSSSQIRFSSETFLGTYNLLESYFSVLCGHRRLNYVN